MRDAETLITGLAEAMARQAGLEPQAEVCIGHADGAPILVPAWKRFRPSALGLVKALALDIGDAGVSFLDSALRLVRASAKLDGVR